MSSSANFRLTFDGPALQNGEMNVRDLTSSLLALTDILDEANRLHTGDEGELVVNIRSIEHGSFSIDLSVAHEWIDQIVKVFSGDRATALGNIISYVSAFFVLIKFSKGRNPKRILPLESQSNKVVIEFSDIDKIEVHSVTSGMFMNRQTRNKATEVVKPLERPGLDSLILTHQSESSVKVTSDDLQSFHLSPIPETLITETIHEATYSILGMWFEGENKWRLSDGTNKYTVTITDGEFLQKVAKGSGDFNARDLLRVRVKVKQWQNENGLKTEYEVVQVIQHIKQYQIPLPFETED